MGFAPVARIAVRYIVGAIIGFESANILANDPDVIVFMALGISFAVEITYGFAKRKGWAT
jgi:hypothetical protein